MLWDSIYPRNGVRCQKLYRSPFRSLFMAVLMFYLYIVTSLLVINKTPNSSTPVKYHVYKSFNYTKFSEVIHGNNQSQNLLGIDGKVDDGPYEEGMDMLLGGVMRCGKESPEVGFIEVKPKIYVFSAFLDQRLNDFDNPNHGNVVRFMAIKHRRRVAPQLSCHFLSGDYMLRTQVTWYEMCENHDKSYGGYILSCLVPSSLDELPCTVTLQLNQNASYLDPGQQFTLHHIGPTKDSMKYDFAVCVPPIFGSLDTSRLVEFVELTQLLGVSHFTFYQDRYLSNNIQNVLKYYSKKGIISVIPWKIPDHVGSDIWNRGQIVAIQDCLYRNMPRARFLSFNDIDEFIVPNKWKDLGAFIRSLDSKDDYAGFSVQSTYFDPNFGHDDLYPQRHLLTLHSNIRARQVSSVLTKDIVVPGDVFEKGIHHVSKTRYLNMSMLHVSPSELLIHHYQRCTKQFSFNCEQRYTSNRIADMYAHLLEPSVLSVMEQLHLVDRY